MIQQTPNHFYNSVYVDLASIKTFKYYIRLAEKEYVKLDLYQLTGSKIKYAILRFNAEHTFASSFMLYVYYTDEATGDRKEYLVNKIRNFEKVDNTNEFYDCFEVWEPVE